jgi:hypothetical protein
MIAFMTTNFKRTKIFIPEPRIFLGFSAGHTEWPNATFLKSFGSSEIDIKKT